RRCGLSWPLLAGWLGRRLLRAGWTVHGHAARECHLQPYLASWRAVSAVAVPAGGPAAELLGVEPLPGRRFGWRWRRQPPGRHARSRYQRDRAARRLPRWPRWHWRWWRRRDPHGRRPERRHHGHPAVEGRRGCPHQWRQPADPELRGPQQRDLVARRWWFRRFLPAAVEHQRDVQRRNRHWRRGRQSHWFHLDSHPESDHASRLRLDGLLPPRGTWLGHLRGHGNTRVCRGQQQRTLDGPGRPFGLAFLLALAADHEPAGLPALRTRRRRRRLDGAVQRRSLGVDAARRRPERRRTAAGPRCAARSA